MKKVLYLLELSVILVILLGCVRHVENTKLIFDESCFKADNDGKVKISGVLLNGDHGNLKANINTKNITVRVEKNGKFEFYYDLKNIQDDKIYLGIESNGVIVGEEAKIKISKKYRDDYLLTSAKIIQQFNYDGYTVFNPREITTQDLNNLGLNTEKIDSVTSEEFSTSNEDNDYGKVRIFTFNSAEKLSDAYDYLISKSRVFPSSGNDSDENGEVNIQHNVGNIAPEVLKRYSTYVKNVNKIPLLNSWVYKAYEEDSGYVLIQQDPTVNSLVAGAHEKILNDLLGENEINDEN